MKVSSREAHKGDSAALAELSGQLGYPATADQMARRLAKLLPEEGQAVFVAEIDGDGLVGWVHVFERTLLVRNRYAEIGGLVIADGFRGQGIGRLLMALAEAWAVERGCREVWVRSNVLREGAHRFYSGLDYETVKTSRVFRKELRY